MNTKKAIRKAAMVFATFFALTTVAQDFEDLLPRGDSLDPEDDPVNNDVGTNSRPAIYFRLELSDNDIRIQDVAFTRVPSGLMNFTEDPSKIYVRACNRDTTLVGSVSVADRQIVARGGETLFLSDRTMSVVVPFLAKPQYIVITLPDAAASQDFSVESAVDSFCADFASDPSCAENLPVSGPYIERLRASVSSLDCPTQSP